MKWETFPHEADVGVRGLGNTLAESFAGATTALTSVICDPQKVGAGETAKSIFNTVQEKLWIFLYNHISADNYTRRRHDQQICQEANDSQG